jgi:threonine dehydratase
MLPTIADVEAAAGRLQGRAHRTPVFTNRTIDARAGRSLFFKAEHLQRCGAFKFRGAANAVFALSEAAAARGVLTDSSGNHGQALAAAAALRGVPATVIMPADAPRVKVAAVEGYGGQVVLCPPTLEGRVAAREAALARTGATFVSSNDDAAVIAGQGTVALELLDEVPDLDAIVAPVGGGGLLAGVALAGPARRPGVAVWGAEPRGADDTARSLAAGRHLPPGAHRSVAGGLLVGMGARPWAVISRAVAGVVVLEEAEIVAAMHLIFERMKQVVEPSAAAALAAVLHPAFPPGLRRVGVVLSGGNVDLERLPWQG